MNHTITGGDIKEDNISAASTGLELDELVSGGSDLLSSSSLECGATWRNVLTKQSGAGHHVSEEHSLESLLVLQQAVQGFSWNLNMTLIEVNQNK